MTLNQRFQELRRKGFCFQFLFPGASQSTGRHSDAKCQRDFTCKHQSHNKYPIKKHVLVCHEHREDADNQQLLEEYKQRCIMNQAQLPAFSKKTEINILYKSISPCSIPTFIAKRRVSHLDPSNNQSRKSRIFIVL